MSASQQRGKTGPKPKYSSLAHQIESLSVKVPFSGCWIWIGSLHNGYGQLTHNGRHMAAHRASLQAFSGMTGRLVCHHCDVRSCVNPSHLYAGDYTSNRADMLDRKRWSHPYAARKTCSAGHSYEEGGYYISKSDSSRVCRTCQREAKRKQRSKQ